MPALCEWARAGVRHVTSAIFPYCLTVPELRQIRIGDELKYADVISSIHNDETVDPEALRTRWEAEARTPQNQGRYLIVDGENAYGIAFWTRPGEWAPVSHRVANVNVRMAPGHESTSDFARFIQEMEAAAKAAGADLARAVAREDEEFHPRALQALGYREDRRSRSWRLTLADSRDALLKARADARKSMSRRGVEIRNFANSMTDANWLEIYRLAAETIPDIPTTFAQPIPGFDEWVQQMRAPGVNGDRIWAAWSDKVLAAYSYLVYPASGDLLTGYTATRKSFRSRGIARALKLESIGQAIELGADSIKTDNDTENSAILHINETLGFIPLPGLVQYVKELSL
jgi:GNAT superfamily N-acetyltransferase